MAVMFPSYLDALSEGFPTASYKTSVPQYKYDQDSQNVNEYIEKLFNRLSVLLFHIDKQINEVLLQGRYLPKKLNQWATEARSLKCQVNDLQKQQNVKGDPVECQELVEMGIKMINHLKKCPFKDDLMYDKPVRIIVLAHESGLDKPNTKLEQKIVRLVRCPRCRRVLAEIPDITYQCGGCGTFLRAKTQKMETNHTELSSQVIESVAKTQQDNASEETAATSSNHDLSSPSKGEPLLNEDNIGNECEDGDSRMELCEDRSFPKNGLNENMPLYDSQQTVESESPAEIQVVHELATLTGAGNITVEQTESCSVSNKHDEESIPSPISADNLHSGAVLYPESTSEVDMPVTISVTGEMSKSVDMKTETLHPSSSRKMQWYNNDILLQEEHYLVSMKDNLIKLELNYQSILIGDCSSFGPHETSPANCVINLEEQDLHELPEKPDYHTSLVLFLQRNSRLTLIHSSFFNSTPHLSFLDLSYTRIRKLPSSLFNLSKLKVLMLRNCVCLENLPSEIGKLNHMEVLDLSGTEIYNLPHEIDQLTRLRHMQLSFYGPDDEGEYVHLPSELICQSILSELKTLEALSIIVHPEDHRWTEIAARITKDVGSLEMLIFFQFYFPEVEMFQDFIQMSPSWRDQRLKKFKFIVGNNVKRIVSRVSDEVESLYDQENQCLRFVNDDKVRVPQVIQTVLTHVTAFYLDHHSQIQSLSEFGISNFKALKFCVVTECPKIQVLLDEVSGENAFSSLEHLRVYYLWELKQIWKIPMPLGNFHALKYLTVNTCPKLHFILGESMLQSLSHLEELVVEDCASVEKIVEEEKITMNHDAIVLPRLRKLVLRYLPKLVSLGNGLHLSEDKVSTYSCPNFILNSQPRRQQRRNFLCSLCGCSM